MLKLIEDLLDHHRIFDAAVRRLGDDFHGTAAGTAGLDLDIEYTLEPVCASCVSSALVAAFTQQNRALLRSCLFVPSTAQLRDLEASPVTPASTGHSHSMVAGGLEEMS
jgi:hypothetical protein